MVWAEIILILIGIAFIGVSFYITETLSQQDLEQISLMSEADLKKISEKQVKEMKDKVENSLEDIIDESLVIAQRGLEKESNNKIMAVSEYSETVLESINNAHNEITFLYSMLNEKQTETAQLVGDLQKLTKQIRDLDLETTIKNLETAANNAISVEKSFETIAAPVVETVEEEQVINETTNLKEFEDVPDAAPVLSKNEQILLLYKEGKDEVEIAKTLDCGLGEVRLVIGLYNEA
ncbi:MAG: hypothetical protein J6I97_06615 [Agathobacter sp.]|nr:hypothetical protein [Agathobacter sp.]